MKQIVVGKVAKPQGIHGEVKVHCYVDAPQGLARLAQVYIGGVSYRILRVRVAGQDAILLLEGIVDRNAAELLRDAEVLVDRADADGLKRGDYFISDLVGLAVVDNEGARWGSIVDVLQYGAADIFDIRLGKRQFLVPFLKRLVLHIDLQQGQMTVDAQVWREVCCEN